MQMPKPSILLGISTEGDDGDDVADALQEFHGHMQSGNFERAADVMRSIHSLLKADHTIDDNEETYG